MVRDYPVTWLWLVPLLQCHAWLARSTGSIQICRCRRNQLVPVLFRLPHLGLVPIKDTKDLAAATLVQDSFQSKLSFKAGVGEYVLGVVEEADYVALAQLIVEAFGAEVIKIGSDVNAFEKMMMAPAVEFLNGSSSLVAFVEVLAGLRSRLRQRQTIDLSPPDIRYLVPKKQDELVSKKSLVFAVSHRDSLVATVELRLQPCDAKIPFSFPTIDTIERNLAGLFRRGAPPKQVVDFQPYLSNLCVTDSQRGKGIGRALVSAVETTTNNVWGYERVYLHVDPGNEAALELYKSEGYTDVGQRWNPFWAGSSARIVYLVKTVTVKT